MERAARKTEKVPGKDLRVGDVVILGGYEWKILKVAIVPDYPRYLCCCRWSGNGPCPVFVYNEFTTAEHETIPWRRVFKRRPNRKVSAATEAPTAP